MGNGKEAVNAALNLAFEKINYHRIEAHINLDNIASIKLAESVGIVYECIRKGFIYENEKWTDHLVYYIKIKINTTMLVLCVACTVIERNVIVDGKSYLSISCSVSGEYTRCKVK